MRKRRKPEDLQVCVLKVIGYAKPCFAKCPSPAIETILAVVNDVSEKNTARKVKNEAKGLKNMVGLD